MLSSSSNTHNTVTADVVILNKGGILTEFDSNTNAGMLRLTTPLSNSSNSSNSSNKNSNALTGTATAISDIIDIPEIELLDNINLVVNNIAVPFVPFVSNVPIVTDRPSARNIQEHIHNNVNNASSASTDSVSLTKQPMPNERIIQNQTNNKIITKQQPISLVMRNQQYEQSNHQHTTNSSNIRSIHKIKKHKITEDEEYKDTRIDYDDDDEEIKKTKLSLFNFVKDIAFNLILTIPTLRTKLKPILNNTSLAITEIEKNFDDFKDELTKRELINIKKYVCVEGIRDKLNYILDMSFKKIMEDGKIDIGDAPQFIQLVYLVIHAFNEINDGEVYKFAVSKEHVMLLLHYILKCVFCLTLDGAEELMAISLLNTSFKLVKIKVCPLISKRWYHSFRKCWYWKKPNTFEDIQ